ncbi:16S rRNA (cytidine(1402)-2'-O)-methyltransferase [Bacillaceae bacterium W0354]
MVHIQKSFLNDRAKLYMVPTPIGNLDDMTFRAINILKEADVIACEDTRQTKKLLNHFQIDTPLISYHEHNKFDRETELISKLKEGQTIALVSDAGMPVISDPGYELVRRAREENIDVVALPGANAALTALVGSGIPSWSFTFCGFLPRKKNEIIEVLKSLGETEHTLIFYESPHRVKKTLQVMKEIYSSDRMITLARELTKKFEEYAYGTIEEIVEWIETNDVELRGEYCLVVEGRREFEQQHDEWWKEMSVIEHVDHYVDNENIMTKEAIKMVAKDRNKGKRDIYQMYHQKDS